MEDFFYETSAKLFQRIFQNNLLEGLFFLKLSQKVIDFLPEVKHRVGAPTNPKNFEFWKIPMFPFHEFMAMNAISQAGLKVEKSF